ncbi:MAG: C39 family peptidase [Sedimentisphaerales bacterium]|nr:C39 family peptidase [Sedimentisphaerales bacterium]
MPTSTDQASFQRRYGDFVYCPIEVVRQGRHYTCGPACLSSVLAYWDIDISEQQIIQKYPSPERRAYLLLALRSIAEAEGLKAYVIAMDTESRSAIEEQIAKGRPVICAVRVPRDLHFFDGVPILGATCRALAWALSPRKDHFVVVAGLKPHKVLIMDPAYGFAALSWRRFEAAWSQMKHACLLVSD